MRFTTVAATLLLSLTAAAQDAALRILSTPTAITLGEPFVVKYTAADLDQPATIILRKGASLSNSQTVGELTSSATGGEYTWTPAKSLTAGKTYTLEIQQANESSTSSRFTLVKPIDDASPALDILSGPATTTAAPILAAAASDLAFLSAPSLTTAPIVAAAASVLEVYSAPVAALTSALNFYSAASPTSTFATVARVANSTSTPGMFKSTPVRAPLPQRPVATGGAMGGGAYNGTVATPTWSSAGIVRPTGPSSVGAAAPSTSTGAAAKVGGGGVGAGLAVGVFVALVM